MGVIGLETGLWLIGIGPGSLDMMTGEAVAAARACEHRFLEGYTAILPSSEEQRLESLVGPWSRRMRSAVEDPGTLLDLARKSQVALLIVGDPLQATTHVDLQLRAARDGVPCHVVHGISIVSLVTGAVGLQSYRFGRQTTLVYPYGESVPTSPLETVLRNRAARLHTVVLLDLDPTGMGEEKPVPMGPQVAIDVLRRSASAIVADGVKWADDAAALDSWDLVLCSDMGTADQAVVAGPPSRIAGIESGRIHCIVVPAPDLHEIEAQALGRWRD